MTIIAEMPELTDEQRAEALRALLDSQEIRYEVKGEKSMEYRQDYADSDTSSAPTSVQLSRPNFPDGSNMGDELCPGSVPALFPRVEEEDEPVLQTEVR